MKGTTVGGLLKIISKYNNSWQAYFSFMILFHIVSVIGLIYSSWHWLWLTLIGVILFRHIGGEIGAHRYFAHRSFKAKPWAHKFMAICGIFIYQGTQFPWVAFHRYHHEKSDTPEDPHSPHYLSPFDVWFTNWRQEIYEHRLYADLVKDTFLKLLHRNYLIIVVPPLVLTALIDWRIPVFFFALPSIITLHTGGLVNTIGHMWGYRNFETTDKSTNNTLGQWLSGFTGSMLHNNHHYAPSAYNTKMSDKWYETDFLNVFIIENFLMKRV